MRNAFLVLMLAAAVNILLLPLCGQHITVNVDARFASSLEEATHLAPLIINARVQAVFPAAEGRRGLYTDVLLQVDTVLKGSVGPREIVVAERGGELGTRHESPSFPMMRVGERYLFFLQPAGPDHSLGPFVARGVERYSLFGSYLGRFRQDHHGLARLNPELLSMRSSSWAGHEGVSVEVLSNQIMLLSGTGPMR